MILRNMSPDISIIMPVKKFLPSMDKAIESIFFQHIPRPLSVELVIIKDGVDDYYINSKVDSYLRLSANIEWLTIKVLELIRNEGQSIARNYGVKNSSGAYICYLDIDDFFHTHRIITGLESLKDISPSSYGAISPYKIIQYYENSNRKKNVLSVLNEKLKGNENDYLKDRRISFLLPFMHRRDLYEKMVSIYGHFFVPGLVDNEDKVLFRRILESKLKVSYCNKPAGTINLRPEGQLHTKEMPNTKRGFTLDTKHPDGRNGQYLDGMKEFSTLALQTFPTKKVCNVCHQTLSVKEFGPWANSLDLKKRYCRPCGAQMERKRVKNYRK